MRQKEPTVVPHIPAVKMKDCRSIPTHIIFNLSTGCLDNLPLEQIQIPTLIVGSKNDGDIGYENSTNSHAKIPNAELITVEQFGHFIWWGDARVIKDFQKRIEIFLDENFKSKLGKPL